MDLLIEFLFDMVFETSVALASSKKAKKWIRYPLIVFVSLFILAILSFVGLFGVFMIANRKARLDVTLGWLLILLDVIMICSAVVKIIRQIRELKLKFAVAAEAEKNKEWEKIEKTQIESPEESESAREREDNADVQR